ncbi:putative eukaryotic translation initiation factor 3 subunit 8 [Trypanosoma vivax]|nr:putative eukaryotic translation initiation factor 3 subunit 8 [Trypanosoma vivax]
MSDYWEQSGSDEEDYETIAYDDQAEAKVSQIDPKWFEITDDEDAEERDVVLSRKEKSLNEVKGLCELLDYHIHNDSWHEAGKTVTELKQKVAAHKGKFGSAPSFFLECMLSIPDLSDKVEENKSLKGPKEMVALKKLIRDITEMNELYKKDAEMLNEEVQEEQENEEEEVMTNEKAAEALHKLMLNHGKKLTQVERLSRTCKKLECVPLHITSMALLVGAYLEDDSEMPFVSPSTWNNAYLAARKCYSLVQNNPKIPVRERFPQEIVPNYAYIVDGFCGMLGLLYTHLLRIEQFIHEARCDHYLVVQMENNLVGFADELFGYYSNRKYGKSICCEVLINIIGARRQKGHELLFELIRDKCSNIVTNSAYETICRLHKEVLTLKDEGLKCRVQLFCVYQMGLEGKYREARDFILGSNVRHSIRGSLQLSILYNRAVLQLGLAAFAAGEFASAHNLLLPLLSNRNHEVLIGQKSPYNAKDNAFVELSYRDLLVPAHTYIPQSQLEHAAMLSALLVNTLDEAKKPYENAYHKNYFCRSLNQMNYEPLLGDPADFRGQISEAYNALRMGDYARARRVVEGMDGWSTMMNGEKSLEVFIQSLKETALRIFCYNNRCNFATISVELMSTKYELTKNEVICIINDIISDHNGPFKAFWDKEDEFLHVDRSNISHLQYLVVGTASCVSDISQILGKRARGNDFRGGRGYGRGRGRGGR